MRPAKHVFFAVITGIVIGTVGGSPALADDSEVFSSSAYNEGSKVLPNILFIMDTSGSMDSPVSNYDPTVDYSAQGTCNKNRVYWKANPTNNNMETPPTCSTSQWVDASVNNCKASVDPLKNSGIYVDYEIMFDGNKTWGDLATGKNASNNYVECKTDNGVHGKNGTTDNTYPHNNTAAWGVKNGALSWTNRTKYALYSGNYANWYYATAPANRESTRLDVVRDAAKSLTDKLQGVNLGLMRYDSGAQGGFVVQPVAELTDTHRTDIKTALDGFTASGNTPLSETLYEAGLYYAGKNVKYGDSSSPKKSINTSRVGNDINSKQYNSPMDYSCQKNYIVYLTDGLPTSDSDANDLITKFDPGVTNTVNGKSVPNDFATVMGSSSCAAVANPDPTYKNDGLCLRDMASYLYKADLSDKVGQQNVTTFMIGFGDDVGASKDYLNTIEAAGTGDPTATAYTARSSSGLVTTLQDIFDTIAEGANVTFTSPTVSVNAFNRAQNLDDLYVSVFSPSEGLHWPGNLKKYKLVDGDIYGQGTDKAVDDNTGFFKDGARSFWSTVDDGPDVTLGGAANLLPSYAQSGAGARQLGTYLGASTNILDSSNLIIETNTALTDTLLGIPDSTSVPQRPAVIQFARGQDLTDLNKKGDNNYQMGDPMHARPAVVIYGGTEAAKNVKDAVVYLPTNDGYLHAIDADTGVERWAFVPPEFLPRLRARYKDNVTTPRKYALDGDVTVLKYDVDGDGIVNPSDGDKVLLFFGFARGGSTYYALDVTDPTKPTFMWKKTATDLPGLGQAWSTPTVARVDMYGAKQNSQKLVLLFGGGYDTAEETEVTTADTLGNRVFMLDLLTGKLLWSAGPPKSGVSLELSRMTNSIAAPVTVLDVDGDGLADRMYAADLGGRIWRFDIKNNDDKNPVIAGGVLAALGAAELTSPAPTDMRRFYNAPDVALVSRRGARPYYNVAIGSGYRGHPLSTKTDDRFYSIRDYLPFTSLDQATYDDPTKFTTITEKTDTLKDITDDLDAVVAEGSAGWYLRLGKTGSGEKVLAQSTTVGDAILFPTFQPSNPVASNPCLPVTLNRAYTVRIDSGKPFFKDRSTPLKQGGIAAAISVLPTKKDNSQPPCTGAACPPPCTGDKCPTPPTPPDSTCITGVEKLNQCVPFGQAIRTFWQRN